MKQAELNFETFNGDFSFNKTNVLSTQINRFSLTDENDVAEKINDKINEQVAVFFDFVSGEFYDQATDELANSSNDVPFRKYDSVLNYQDTYNSNCVLSFYRDEYYFSGGAHGSTTRKSNTFNLNNSLQIPLRSFFKADWKETILNQILIQAKHIQEENPNIFFEDYENLIIKNFNAQNYYVSNKGIVIYFQQYDIAPYSTGIVEFTIPFDDVPYPPNCE